jgi:hypothetical protein
VAAAARLARKGNGTVARPCYAGHALTENRNGLIVEAELTQASGTAEREAGLRLTVRQRGRSAGRLSVVAAKGYDAARFVVGVRALGATPKVACKKRFSTLDGRTTRHGSYAVSQRRRKLLQEGFGWMKDVGGLCERRHRGRAKASALFSFACAAYNLVHLRTLLAEPSSPRGKTPILGLPGSRAGSRGRETRPPPALRDSPSATALLSSPTSFATCHIVDEAA